ncbi:MAG: hypothetical protein QXZ20_03335 [Candidatus Aenigmatarchaeota archaeon]
MKGQTAIEYLMTYGWAILIILIVAGVLAYYGIFAPAGFLAPTARGFGQVQVLNPWSVVGSSGAITLNLENRVGGTITITDITYNDGTNTYSGGTCTGMTNQINSGEKAVVSCTPASGPGASAGSSYTLTLTITYQYQGGNFTSTGTISGTYS